jgi:UDP-N-acetylmuramate--alanine ligase
MPALKNLYFIGIGGIGMSALARYYRSRGAEVWGYDRTRTPLTRELEGEGMHIHYTEDVSQIPKGVELVIYTPAVPADHAELVYFRQHGYEVIKRAELLGRVSRDASAIAIAGTHGKTTTSSLLTALLRRGGVDCTAFLGGIALDFGSNYVAGAGEWVVAEADEYDKSFLQLQPRMAAILSMDADHLDIYGDAKQMQEQGYLAFARQLKPGGVLFIRHDLRPYFEAFPEARDYGVDAGTYRSVLKGVRNGKMAFDYQAPGVEMKDLELALPGRHNVENATVAIALALETGVGEAAIREALSGFKGIKRRFERVTERYVDDYAHHPSELTEAIRAARAVFPGKRLRGIFQPHLYSRTRDFQEGFAQALDLLDEPWLLPIYPAREKPIPGVDSELILSLMKNPAKRLMRMDEVIENLEKYPPEVLLTLGAGDIDTLVEPIKNWMTAH